MLAHHSEVRLKLQTEVDTVLGDRSPTSDDLQKLSYTRMIVKETLRIRPPVWALGRQTRQDCEIGGGRIPAGSTVLMSQWVTHHNSRFYDNPLQFRPERWFSLESPPFPQYAFFPFGGGNRICIGEHFAMTKAIAVLGMIARRWNMSPTQASLAKPNPSVTLRPDRSIKLIIKRRAVK